MNRDKIDLTQILEVGEENAKKTSELMAILNFDNVRSFRQFISKYRLTHSDQIICASSNGYFIPASTNEIDEYIAINEKKAKKMLLSLKSAKKQRQIIQGQISMK